jgi:hypothetical protein
MRNQINVNQETQMFLDIAAPRCVRLRTKINETFLRGDTMALSWDHMVGCVSVLFGCQELADP